MHDFGAQRLAAHGLDAERQEMPPVKRRHGQQIDNRKVETEESCKVQQRHNPHLCNLACHLCNADWSRELRSREFENDAIECVEHHHDDHPRPLKRHGDRLEKAGITALVGIHDADIAALLRRIVVRHHAHREFFSRTIHLHRHRDIAVV